MAQPFVEALPRALGAQPRPFGRWTFSLLGIGGQNFLRTFDTSHDKGFSEFGTVAVEADKFVSRRIEIGLAVHPLMVIRQPETAAGESRESVAAFSADFIARWYPGPFHWLVRPYVEIGEGALYALRRVPSSGTRWNYLGQLGFGVTFAASGPWSVVGGYRWLHISNAGTGEHNPSWNYHGLVLGARLFVR